VDIEEFYEQDERRRASEEVELGMDWHDEMGNRYELSWVVDTGELYLMIEPVVEAREDLFGDIFPGKLSPGQLSVAVLGVIPTREELERVLEGWQEAMGKPASLKWLSDRLSKIGKGSEGPSEGSS
jgi:hypothetical protein